MAKNKKGQAAEQARSALDIAKAQADAEAPTEETSADRANRAGHLEIRRQHAAAGMRAAKRAEQEVELVEHLEDEAKGSEPAAS